MEPCHLNCEMLQHKGCVVRSFDKYTVKKKIEKQHVPERTDVSGIAISLVSFTLQLPNK